MSAKTSSNNQMQAMVNQDFVFSVIGKMDGEWLGRILVGKGSSVPKRMKFQCNVPPHYRRGAGNKHMAMKKAPQGR
ncbi:hypothetical protein [Limnohabitans sp. DM1]|uniref:hypothetical protein n=1 Tax=Limnohabitans sp. DM1 TaxID=1597955 RepID=UPI001892C31E|nr:hypothetical protein [Limnohabitans sp. DM1]